jgi:hypothetical protein
MLRKLAVLAILAVVLAAAYGSASGLIVSGGAVQVGSDVTYCDTDGVVVDGWGLETDLEPDYVGSVRITGIAEACKGNLMFVQLYDGTQTKIFGQSLSVAIDNTTESVPFPVHVNPEEIDQIRIWIEGPSN